MSLSLKAWWSESRALDLLAAKARPRGAPDVPGPSLADLLDGFSIEVMPRTAALIPDFPAILPRGTRVYIAHIDGTPIDAMVATARRLAEDGFRVMPHFPARCISDIATLADWIARYQGEAGVNEALLLGGGITMPRGSFDSSMQLLDTGLFGEAGFTRLHVAGHPEGNRDIAPDDTDAPLMEALRWKQAFADRSDACMGIVTQFCFDAAPVIDWMDRLRAESIDLPVHLGVAGPAKLQALIKFSVLCGVGASIKVLRKRARDITKMVRPVEPTGVLTDMLRHKSDHPDFRLPGVHLFPLGGVTPAALWARAHSHSHQRTAHL